MKVLNLRCAHDHGFEGWFASEDDFLSQSQRGAIECPWCGDADIARLPSAPRLNISGARAPNPVAESAQSVEPAGRPDAIAAELQSMWLKRVSEVLANTEDVFRSVMSIAPGACVMQNSGRASAITACGVTPQAQNSGSSSVGTSMASPQSGLARFEMPIFSGRPMCTGAPCTPGKREVICTARIAFAGVNERIDTTRGP